MDNLKDINELKEYCATHGPENAKYKVRKMGDLYELEVTYGGRSVVRGFHGTEGWRDKAQTAFFLAKNG